MTNLSSGGGSVASVFGRTGAVVAASNDYTAAQVGAVATNDARYLASITNHASGVTLINVTLYGNGSGLTGVQGQQGELYIWHSSTSKWGVGATSASTADYDPYEYPYYPILPVVAPATTSSSLYLARSSTSAGSSNRSYSKGMLV